MFGYEINKLMLSGIYKITCLGNNKIYIGSASSTKAKSKSKKGFFCRWSHHLRQLKQNKHHNKPMQNAYNKYGEENFVFEILEFCEPHLCIKREQYYLDLLQPFGEKGFNICKNSLVNNKNFTEDHRLKLSLALKGKKRNLDDVKKWSNPVRQYDLDGNFIAEYYSISEASRITNIQRQDIGQSIIGKKCKTAGGFIWKKVKDIV